VQLCGTPSARALLVIRKSALHRIAREIDINGISNLDAHFVDSVQLDFLVKKGFSALLLLVVVCVVYAPAIHDGFVWDDTALILRDPLIRSWRLIPEGFNHFLFVDATPSDFYRPLQRLSYTIDYAAFAFRPGPYHVMSVLWHAAAAIALFFFAVEFLRTCGVQERARRYVAFFAALVWAIHPVQSAAVVYISGRADPLGATFGFLGLYLCIRGQRAGSRGKLIFLIAGGVAFLLSALSKESGLIFPVIAIAFFALGRKWIDLWKSVAVAGFVCAVYFSLRAGAEQFPVPRFSPPPPLLVKPVIMARAVAEYTGLILLPLHLHMDRDVETHPMGITNASMSGAAWRELQTLLGILIVAAVVYWMVRARKRNPAVFACLLFALISYLPISGIVALNATVAEHWIYLPTAFFFLAVAIEAGSFLENPAWRRRSTTVVVTSLLFGAWLVFLGARTFIRNFDWKDQRTFLKQTIASGGDSARMLINLGTLDQNEGKLEDAAVQWHAALQKEPDQPLAVVNLGALALKQNDFKLARQLLTRATQMPLVNARAHELLAILEYKQNGHVDLIRLRLAARTGPPDWAIEKRYIEVLDEGGATTAAIKELFHCLQSQWYRAESWQLLSKLFAREGHPDRAAGALAQARAYDVHLGAHQATGAPDVIP
jgi:tetratricopeptide (TPR) repeat protein